jgi:hypothetical protein
LEKYRKSRLLFPLQWIIPFNVFLLIYATYNICTGLQLLTTEKVLPYQNIAASEDFFLLMAILHIGLGISTALGIISLLLKLFWARQLLIFCFVGFALLSGFDLIHELFIATTFANDKIVDPTAAEAKFIEADGCLAGLDTRNLIIRCMPIGLTPDGEPTIFFYYLFSALWLPIILFVAKVYVFLTFHKLLNAKVFLAWQNKTNCRKKSLHYANRIGTFFAVTGWLSFIGICAFLLFYLVDTSSRLAGFTSELWLMLLVLSYSAVVALLSILGGTKIRIHEADWKKYLFTASYLGLGLWITGCVLINIEVGLGSDLYNNFLKLFWDFWYITSDSGLNFWQAILRYLLAAFTAITLLFLSHSKAFHERVEQIRF